MESAFDQLAKDYDASFTNTPIGKLQRNRVHCFLNESLKVNTKTILEINCGSGKDAFWLAEKDLQVTATDASATMIEVVKRKSTVEGRLNSVTAIQLSFSELKKYFGELKFDFIFSNFGGLNCASPQELTKLANDFSSLLNENGKFIAVVMGKKCLWERIYFRWKGKPKQAMRRNSKQKLEVRIGDAIISTWYYSPAEFSKIFSVSFDVVKIKPVGLFIPPSYLNSFFVKKNWLLAILNVAEKIFSFSWLSDYADHYFIELKRKN
ncbi:MAG: class I SAM-dependent methyltransferase [Chitinophagales bacterium]|nr:class I SAM-dependent methyltransferase [Chitinophagales bacterium]